MLVRFQLVVVLKVIYQNMPIYSASAFPFSLQRCPTIDAGRPSISDSILRMRFHNLRGKQVSR